MAIFLKKMTIFGNFFKKMSSFWQFLDSQMAILRRVRLLMRLLLTQVSCVCQVIPERRSYESINTGLANGTLQLRHVRGGHPSAIGHYPHHAHHPHHGHVTQAKELPVGALRNVHHQIFDNDYPPPPYQPPKIIGMYNHLLYFMVVILLYEIFANYHFTLKVIVHDYYLFWFLVHYLHIIYLHIEIKVLCENFVQI